MKSHLTAALVTGAALATVFACARKEDGDTAAVPRFPQTSPLLLTGGIDSFPTCAAAESFIEDTMIAELERSYAWRIASLEKNGREKVVSADAAPESAPGVAPPPEARTGTNDQVSGVEEADLVKTTAHHLFQAVGRHVQIVKTWPAAEMATVASLPVEGDAFQLLLDGEARLVVLSRPTAPAPKDGSPSFVPYPDASRVRADVVDVADPAAPKITASYELAGSLRGARRVDGSVRLVLTSQSRWPEGVSLYPMVPKGAQLSVAMEIAWLRGELEKAKELLRAQPLGYWLQRDGFVRIAADGTRTPLLGEPDSCAGMFAPKTPARTGVTRVLTLGLADGHVEETVLASDVAQVYATKETLYLTTPYYWWDDESHDTDFTYVHRFDTPVTGGIRFAGSGGVEGTVLDQFSLDESEGNLRVATTIRHRPKDGERWGAWTTTNRVTVLGLEGDVLVERGRTPDVAEGERVYSARFDGAKGYVVTFRQMDPLYTLDLADPAHPRVVGELKVPGFSTYIHQLDAGHLLTIGREADPVTGRMGGPKVSVFDVTDLAAPKQLYTLPLGEGTWTEAQWSHLAFTYFREKGLLALPVSGYQTRPDGTTGPMAGLEVLKIDLASGIAPVGTLEMTDVAVTCNTSWGPSSRNAWVTRAYLADDFVYAISDLGVRVADGKALGAPVATVTHPQEDVCRAWGWYGYE